MTMIKLKKEMSSILILLCFLVISILTTTVTAWTHPTNPPFTGPLEPSYDGGQVDTGCDCQKANVLVPATVAVDWPQDTQSQATLWAWWSQGTTGWTKLGNATHVYNCHSYIFNGSDRWLNPSERSKYLGSNTGCWISDDNGTIRSSSAHSCTSGYDGKVGSIFLQNKNDDIYGLISAKYKKKT